VRFRGLETELGTGVDVLGGRPEDVDALFFGIVPEDAAVEREGRAVIEHERRFRRER
jgi:hypothetical protein